MKKLLLITVAVTIISGYLRANEDKERSHLASIKEKILTTAESAEPTVNKKKNNVVNTVNSVHQAEEQSPWKQFKQGETYPIAIATFVGISTGAISGIIRKKTLSPSHNYDILVLIAESMILSSIITDLQNNINQDNKKESTEKSTWFSSWKAYRKKQRMLTSSFIASWITYGICCYSL